MENDHNKVCIWHYFYCFVFIFKITLNYTTYGYLLLKNRRLAFSYFGRPTT